MSQVFDNFIAFYQAFSSDSLTKLHEIYAHDVVFRDPIHEINGLNALQAYFQKSMQNIHSCRFEFTSQQLQGSTAHTQWLMHYSHPRIKGGRPLVLEGVTIIEIDDKITFHRDYYDMGELLYEHLPVLGNAVKYLKRNIAS